MISLWSFCGIAASAVLAIAESGCDHDTNSAGPVNAAEAISVRPAWARAVKRPKGT